MFVTKVSPAFATSPKNGQNRGMTRDDPTRPEYQPTRRTDDETKPMDRTTTPRDDLASVFEEHSLPVVLRGYDRGMTDELLSKVEASLKAVLVENGAARARIEQLERRIAEGRENEQAITEALVVAARVRGESEREGKEIKAEYVREAEALKAAGKQEADEILKEAEAEAAKILEDARLKARGLEEEVRDAEEYAEQARSRLRAYLESLLAEIEPRGAKVLAAVDDLSERARDSAEGDQQIRRRAE